MQMTNTVSLLVNEPFEDVSSHLSDVLGSKVIASKDSLNDLSLTDIEGLAGFVIIDTDALPEEHDNCEKLFQALSNRFCLLLRRDWTDIAPPIMQRLMSAPCPVIQFPLSPHSVTVLKNYIEVSAHQQTEIKRVDLLERCLQSIGQHRLYLDNQGNVVLVDWNETSVSQQLTQGAVNRPWYYVLKVRRDLSSAETIQFISNAINVEATTKFPPIAIELPNQQSKLVDGLICPVTYADGSVGRVIIIRELADLDSIEDLTNLYHESTSNNASQQAMLLLSPDKLRDINRQFGRETGDRLLMAVGQAIHQYLRPTDIVDHFGGATFVVILRDYESAQVEHICKKIFSTLQAIPIPDSTINPTFSIGLAISSQNIQLSPLELFHNALLSLNHAQTSGGAQIKQWDRTLSGQQIGNLDKLSGNFSQNVHANYIKMMMSWNILTEVNDAPNRSAFVEALMRQLVKGLALESATYADLLGNKQSNRISTLKNGNLVTSGTVALSEHQKRYLSQYTSNLNKTEVFTSVDEYHKSTLIPVTSHKNVIGFVLLQAPLSQAYDTKSHLLLKNIGEFIRFHIQKYDHIAIPPQEFKPNIDDEHAMSISSPAMLEQMSLLKRVAPTDANILITGESGTGKELLAHAIHRMSHRNHKPLVIFDCGAVVDSLIESELFGHVKGAFTGATTSSTGAILKASEGTLFLDEIGELPLETQVKLLRFTQSKQFSAVGDHNLKQVDVRIIAATNVDLEKKVREGTFREDLYYRLNVINVNSPPLRERSEDIVPIAEMYLEKFSRQYDKQITGFSQSSLQALQEYSWPGNVRELVNLIHRAVVICDSVHIETTDLGLFPDAMNATRITENASVLSDNSSNNIATNTQESSVDDIWQSLITCLQQTAETIDICKEIEKRLYKHALDITKENVAQAAAYVGIAETTFRRRWDNLKSLTQPISNSLNDTLESLVTSINKYRAKSNRVHACKLRLVKACEDIGLNTREASQLLLISRPTYRKLLEESSDDSKALLTL